MKTLELPVFSAPGIAAILQDMSDDDLNALPFGVVEMDSQGHVTRYNAAESRLSGLPCERVVGRHFFREVAPCADNEFVAQRYALENLDETIAYTFSLRMKPVPVTLRLLKQTGGRRMYLLVTW